MGAVTDHIGTRRAMPDALGHDSPLDAPLDAWQRRELTDTFGQRDELGFRQPAHEMCSLLDGGSHVPTWVRAMHEAGVHTPLVIENFSGHADNGQLLTESAQQLQAVMKTLA